MYIMCLVTLYTYVYYTSFKKNNINKKQEKKRVKGNESLSQTMLF